MGKKTVILGILLILWMGFIFYMSSKSGDDSGRESERIVDFVIQKYDEFVGASDEIKAYHHSEEFLSQANLYFRKLCHFSEYFILSVLFISFFFSWAKFKNLYNYFWSFLLSFLYACTDEFHQTFISERSGNIIDLIIDTSGILVGIGMIWLIKKCQVFKNVNQNNNLLL